jgi:hypothetical protein
MLLRLLLITCLTTTALLKASAFGPACTKSPNSRSLAAEISRMEMSVSVNRRTLFANAITAAALLSTAPASFALNSMPADNEIVKEQRTVTGKLDVNNAAVADYMKYPGLYPNIGGKIANNGPYKKVTDVYKFLSTAEKKKLKEYASELTATPATGLDTMRGRDPYRRSFNAYKEVKVNVQ